MRSRPKTGVLAVAAASLALAALAPLPALADGPVRLTLHLGSRCLTGHKTTSDPITVKVLRSDGKVLETRQDDTTELEWRICFAHAPIAGDRIRLVHFNKDRTVRVPELTIGLDRVTNVVRGHAPAGKPIGLAYVACDAAGHCADGPAVMVIANSHGRYRKDLSPAIDIDGSDLVRAEYTNAHEDLFYRGARAPYMTITSPDRISLSCLPRGTTTVRLLSSTGVLRAVGSFHMQRDCGTVSGRFRKHGHSVNIHAGDRVKSDFASDAKLIWPTSVAVAASGYAYSMRCFPDAEAYLTILVNGSVIWSYAVTTDADGRYSQSAGYQLIPPGATVRVACESSRGDRVTASGKAS